MFFICWIILAILCGSFASKRGRDGGRWFFIALIFSPLIGFIGLLISDDKQPEIALNNAVNNKELKKCLYCAELIKTEATKCKHCGADLPAPASL